MEIQDANSAVRSRVHAAGVDHAESYTQGAIDRQAQAARHARYKQPVRQRYERRYPLAAFDDYSREKPVKTLALTAVAGFMLARLLRR
jgi:ElaB/YqjD/DUF883 family membrane-anchored ribosome-binding protein